MKIHLGYDEILLQQGHQLYLDWCLGNGLAAHVAISGESGSGKTFLTQNTICRLYLKSIEEHLNIDFYLADFKGDPSYSFIHRDNCPRYFVFEETINAITIFYNKFKQLQVSGDYKYIDNQISILVLDEYMSLLSYLENKERNNIQNKISILLNMGRAQNFYLFFVQQRLDAKLFDISRDNLSYLITLGNCSKEVVHMLYQNYIEQIEPDRSVGTGYYLHNGVFRKFVSPWIKDRKKVQECIQQLVSVPLT